MRINIKLRDARRDENLHTRWRVKTIPEQRREIFINEEFPVIYLVIYKRFDLLPSSFRQTDKFIMYQDAVNGSEISKRMRDPKAMLSYLRQIKILIPLHIIGQLTTIFWFISHIPANEIGHRIVTK